MLRRPFTLLSAVSLFLCVGVCVLWVRSYWVQDVAGWCRPDPGDPARLHTYNVSTERGTVTLTTVHGPAAVFNKIRPGFYHRPVSPDPEPGAEPAADGFWRRAGFGRERFDVRWLRVAADGVFAPMWLPAVVAGLLPLMAGARGAVRQLRAWGGLCRSCGYDLRASPGRCPECGQMPAHFRGKPKTLEI